MDQADQRHQDHATLIGELKKVLAVLSSLQNECRDAATFIGMTKPETEQYDVRAATIKRLTDRLLQLEKDEELADHSAIPQDGSRQANRKQ